MSIVKIEDIADLIIELREEKVILDNDVAKLYGVETKRINEAVKNNPDKFPHRLYFWTDKRRVEYFEVENFDFKKRW